MNFELQIAKLKIASWLLVIQLIAARKPLPQKLLVVGTGFDGLRALRLEARSRIQDAKGMEHREIQLAAGSGQKAAVKDKTLG